MTLYMLDTNAASAVVKGDAGMRSRLDAIPGTDWCISVITRAEMQYGLALRPEATRLGTLVRAFLSMARTIAWDAVAADRHARVRAALRAQPIGSFDEMIAAHCLSLGAVLVTDNVRHFARIPDLSVENWQRS